MKVLMQCVAEAVVANGVRGLAEMVPGGGFLFNVASDALKRFRERRARDQVSDELKQLAEASFEEAKATAQRVAREVAANVPAEEQQALELYLAQIPGAVRRSLRRADDPTGKTVPPNLTLNTPNDLLQRLPLQMPKFRPGDPLPGAGGWTLREPLGTGGFGEVWQADNELVPDLRAVKFCTDPDSRERLLTHEGKLVARVMREGKHPNVVGLVDAHLKGESPWLAYEFVGGGDLTGVGLAWRKLSPEDRVKQVGKALKQLAGAAGHFHRLSPPIVHRDLKPANILYDAKSRKLRITDFGIGGLAAAQELAADVPELTKSAALLAGSFTPLYASPQQRAGSPPDPRDDVHALGVIAYQLLTGRFDRAPGPRFERDLKAVGVPEELTRLIGDCVDPDPNARPRDGGVLADRLPAALTTEPMMVLPAEPVMAKPAKVVPVARATVAPAREAKEPTAPVPVERPPALAAKRKPRPMGIVAAGAVGFAVVAAIAFAVLRDSAPDQKVLKSLAVDNPSPAETPKGPTQASPPPAPPKPKLGGSRGVDAIFDQLDLPLLYPEQKKADRSAHGRHLEPYYEIDEADALGESEPAKYPVRDAVRAALKTIRDTWNGFPAMFLAFEVEERGPATKARVAEVEGHANRAIAKLTADLTSLKAAEAQKDRESQWWRLHHQFTLGQVYLRIAYLHEYLVALADVRKDQLPTRNKDEFYNVYGKSIDDYADGWRLVGAFKFRSRDAKEYHDKGRDSIKDLAFGVHRNSPWADVANTYYPYYESVQWWPKRI